MKTSREIMQESVRFLSHESKEFVYQLVDEARIDTLEHLLEQFRVNQKKLSPKGCIELIEELISEIKK